jgi:hypothetical protein
MPLFARPHYMSDATQFINHLHQQRPTLDAEQYAGRARLWDQDLDRDEEADLDAGTVAQQPYVYQTKG